jgi:hypothetical protein
MSNSSTKMIRELRFSLKRRRVWYTLTIGSALLVVSTILVRGLPERLHPAPLPHSVYVWQREWTDGVREGVRRSQETFADWVVLAAEVEFRAGMAPRVARVAPDYDCLRGTGRPAGLAVRVAPHSGSFEAHGPESLFLTRFVRELLEDARRHGIEPATLHLDFDAATRQLAAYRLWLTALREAARPTPLVVTVLPTWLDSPDFARLIEAADGYVLQVHSWQLPTAPGRDFQLCDTKRARAAIDRAARFGRPFWVALPTYGYRAWFDPRGRLVRLAAEGPELSASAGLEAREVRADPTELAALVRWLQDRRPESLRGLIWYRLPQSEDRLNWHWRTLEAVIQGRVPQTRTEWRLEPRAEGLVEISAYAAGEADSLLDRPVRLSWAPARLLAADGLAGFTAIRAAPDALSLSPANRQPARLSPGQKLIVGWLRFDHPTEVQIHEEKAPAL